MIKSDEIVQQTTRWQIVYEDVNHVEKRKQTNYFNVQDEYLINHS
jgi:hypothetical protein